MVDLREKGASLDFLGYTFHFQRNHFGGTKTFLSMHPSAKAVAREKEHLRQLVNSKQTHLRVPIVSTV